MFDRHKAELYRLYNRELRRDPTLRGQMILRLTIEPDGSVSMCELRGSDMNAPELAAQVVDARAHVRLRREGGHRTGHDPVSDRFPAGGVTLVRLRHTVRRRHRGMTEPQNFGSTYDAIQTKANPPKGGDAKSPV